MKTVVSSHYGVCVATEKQIERMCIKLYQTCGCEVLKFSQPRNTMQTYGIPDLKIYHRAKQKTWWHEVKGPKGKLSEHQLKIMDLTTHCGETFYHGGLNAAVRAVNEQLGLHFKEQPEEWLT